MEHQEQQQQQRWHRRRRKRAAAAAASSERGSRLGLLLLLLLGSACLLHSARAEPDDLGGLRPPGFRPPSIFSGEWGGEAASGHSRRRLQGAGGNSSSSSGSGDVVDAWIRPPKFPTVIPGQFVAVLHDDAARHANATTRLDSFFASLRAEGVQRIAHWKGGGGSGSGSGDDGGGSKRGRGVAGFAFRLPPAMQRLPGAASALLAAVRALPSVAHVEPDQVFYAQVITAEARGGKWEVPTPLFRMRAAAWSTKAADGALVQPNCTRAGPCGDVVVAVLDTGVDGSHPDLAGNVVGGESFIGGNALVDENGHGTHVAGTVCANNNGMGTMGLTPGQRVFALQVFDRLGSGSTSSIVAALNWLARYGRAKGIRVANMSLGGPKSWAVCAALDAVVRQGITLVVAAGNKGVPMYGSSPADCDNALAVTSMTDYDGKPGGLATPADMANADDSFTDFSNYAAPYSAGRTVASPGRLVLSTWSQRACGRYGVQCVPWGPYAFMSGTSMAAPLVAALTARCYAKGACAAEGSHEIAKIVANSVRYNAANRGYGFAGDPLRPVRGNRYFGYLVWGNQW